MTAVREMLAVGKPLPDVSLTDLDGNEASLRDRRGGRTLIYFWGSW